MKGSKIMSLKSRLEKIRNIMAPSDESVVRIAGHDGYYPEAEEDKKHGRKVIQIIGRVNGKGVTYDEIKQWAK